MKKQSTKTGGTEHVSRDVVRLLNDPNGRYGSKLKKIGEAINCCESFVSMVGSGKRSLTLNHLTMLEKKLGEPVAILLLKSIDPKKVDNQLRPLYNRFMSRVTAKTAVKAKEKRKAAGKTKQRNPRRRVAV